MKMPNLLACLAATWLVGDLAMADISITGGRMANPGRHPFKDSETIGAFVERIGGIKPTVYQGVEKPFPYPITSLRILRDRLWSDTYSLKRDATHLWNHKLKDGDLIELLTVSIFAYESARKWQGEYRDEWTIRIPKKPDQAKEKVFSWSLFNTEVGYRQGLMEAFPGLEMGCYHFSGKRMMGVLEDFDHGRVLLLVRPGADETVSGVMINGKDFDFAGAVPAAVKVFGMACVADDPQADDPKRIEEERLGHWIPMEATDRFAVRIQSLFPDRGLFIARYDPDDGWSSAYELSDAEEPEEVKPPADAYELTRKSLLARVLQVLEKKPECVVRKQNDIDLKLARPPEGFWEDEVEPMRVILADRILIGRGGASKEVDPSQLQRYFEMYLSAAMSAQASPRVLVQVGKHATDARFRDFLAAIRATYLRLVYLASDPHGAFLGCDASGQPVLKQLEAITVPEIDLPKQPFSAALDSLQQRYSNGKIGGVINFIVRGPANGPPAVSGSDRAENSVSLQAKNLSFAGAIDALCVQAGCEWWLESNIESPPLLVIRRRNEQQRP